MNISAIKTRNLNGSEIGAVLKYLQLRWVSSYVQITGVLRAEGRKKSFDEYSSNISNSGRKSKKWGGKGSE